ncbi:lysophospholipase L1-like esterase [Catalinimonas alkaloidigena]|uniref:GDSL-type esterase/lipase family protein n=1 Tax=Catalinimonas alkaloidigena TaxID=1075417 RepID=UPI002406D1F3|nr:GDSL-type esterase/lipase family protein [Catalinimonas alkaloidigena]MDF9798347.1 lysophospholipase L1-like esterase [Catalinimonas alkaloidigena]
MKLKLLLFVCLLGISITANGVLMYYFISRERGIFSKRHRREIVLDIKKKRSNNNWIVFLGNSITERNDWVNKYHDKDVINLGKGGDTVEGVLFRLDEAIQLEPAKIFLLIGINDIRYGLKKSVIIDNYDLLIRIIKEKSPYTELYVQSVFPLIEKSEHSQQATNEKIVDINQSIKRLTDIYGIQYVDLYGFFTFHSQLKPEYTDDGLHLNEKGYKLWERVIHGFVYSNDTGLNMYKPKN